MKQVCAANLCYGAALATWGLGPAAGQSVGSGSGHPPAWPALAASALLHTHRCQSPLANTGQQPTINWAHFLLSRIPAQHNFLSSFSSSESQGLRCPQRAGKYMVPGIMGCLLEKLVVICIETRPIYSIVYLQSKGNVAPRLRLIIYRPFWGPWECRRDLLRGQNT